MTRWVWLDLLVKITRSTCIFGLYIYIWEGARTMVNPQCDLKNAHTKLLGCNLVYFLNAVWFSACSDYLISNILGVNICLIWQRLGSQISSFGK